MRTTKQAIHTRVNNSWLDIHQINQEDSISEHYLALYQEHHINNKWLLMINPEDNSLAKLNHCSAIDTSKILKVDPAKKAINLNNIKSALYRGNCSAVVLCNPSLNDDELAQLQQYAQSGKTQCVVINSQVTVH